MNKQLFTSMVAQYTEQPKWADGDTLEWSGGAHCNLPSLVFNGECQQSGTPTPDNPIPIYSFNGLALVRGRDSYLYTPYLNGIVKEGTINLRDKWDYVTGKGLRYIHKVELDGVSEYGKVNTSYLGAAGVICCSFKREFHISRNGGGGFMSTHFKGSWNNTAVGCVFTTNMNSKDNTYFTLDSNRYPDVASANAWLAEQYANGTPVTVYYALAEPIPFEERSEYDVYEPIPNDSGHIDTVDSSIHPPFNITYITHS